MHLSSNLKELNYSKSNNKKTCWDKIRGSGSIYLSEIADIAFGAITSTFARISPSMIRIQARQRPNIRRLYPHYDDRRDLKVMEGDGNDRLPFYQETFFTEPDEKVKLEMKDFEYYSWQCVSFVRFGGTTLDLIVKDEDDMMALINVVQQSVYKPAL